MKFSVNELHVRISKVKPSRKRKRSTSREVVIVKTRAEAIQDKMEPVTTMSHVLAALTMASLFRIAGASPKAGEEVGCWPNEEVISSLQGSIEVPLEVELALDAREVSVLRLKLWTNATRLAQSWRSPWKWWLKRSLVAIEVLQALAGDSTLIVEVPAATRSASPFFVASLRPTT